MSPNRLVRAGDLVLQKDLVERLGLDPTLLANLAGGRRNAAEFPRPVTGRGSRGIWLWSEVEQWYETKYPEYMASRRAAPGVSRQRDPRPSCKGRGRKAA